MDLEYLDISNCHWCDLYVSPVPNLRKILEVCPHLKVLKAKNMLSSGLHTPIKRLFYCRQEAHLTAKEANRHKFLKILELDVADDANCIRTDLITPDSSV